MLPPTIGLAQAAVHRVATSNLISREFLAILTAHEFMKTSFAGTGNGIRVNPQETNALGIMVRILHDPRLGPGLENPNRMDRFDITMAQRGSLVREHVEQWDLDDDSSAAVNRRIEEMAWLVSIIYGVGGHRKDKPFKADFYMLVL
jgi:hypothetical protein